MTETAISSDEPGILNISGDLGDDCLPPDPLLQSGTYIDGEPNASLETTPQRDVSDLAPSADSLTPSLALSDQTPAADTVTPQQRQIRSALVTPERPSWLPENWKIETKVRVSGATAGSVDRYYLEPVSGKKFRSKNEVLYFLETGSKAKGKRKKGSTNSEVMPPEISKSQKQKKVDSKTKKITSFYFDSVNPPESVCWVLKDCSADTWAPSCNGGMVPERRKCEWDAVFSSVSRLQPRNV